MKKFRTKKVLVIFISFVSVFIIYNIVWGAFMLVRWKPLIKPIDYNDFGECTVISDDGYRYSAFKPSYLSFSGNLSLKKYEAMNESSSATSCSLIIWPKFNGDYEIGVSISVCNEEDSQDGGFAFSSYGFILDENRKPLDNLNDAEKQVLEENAEIIELLYRKAYDMWGIGG